MLPLAASALLALLLSFNVTKEDVRRLLNAGVSDQTIVEFIRRNAPAEPLSVEDVTELKAVGASDAVLNAMLVASRTSDVVTPAPSSRNSYSSGSTTYVVPEYYPSYSYSYSYPGYSYPYYSSYTPYYYPYYSYYYRPYSYYRYPYSYPYYNRYNYPRTYPQGVSPYRNQHQPVRPQMTQPVQPHRGGRGGAGTYRR